MKFISILLVESRKEDLKNKYKNSIDSVVLDSVLNLPELVSFNHKYTDFVLKNLIDLDPENIEDILAVTLDLIKKFDKYQSQLEKKDINQYNDFVELESVLWPLIHKSKVKDLESKIDRIYEDDKFLVIKPNSHEASCKYGANTKWCTTSQSDDHFKRYTSGNQALYYVINKTNSTNKNYSKVAIHYDGLGNSKYWDSQDNPMNEREIEVLKYAFPEIMVAIEKDYEKISKSATETILKEIFNSSGKSVMSIKNYFGPENNLTIIVEGFETIDDLGPGHAQGKCSVILNRKLTDQYFIFITYKPTNQRYFESDIGFMGTDDFIETDDFIDLGLEGWGFDIKTSMEGFPQTRADQIRDYIARKVLDHVKDSTELRQKLVGSKKVWTPNRSSYGYTFGKNKGLIKKLIDYLDDGYDNGTKLDFLEYIGKIKSRVVNGKKEYRHSNREIFSPKSDFRGHFSSFFASAKNAGIIQYQKQGRDYIIKKGPNFDAFKNGELKAL